MKRKSTIILVTLLLLVAGAFCAFLIYDAYRNENSEPETVLDIPTQIKENEDTAFSFLKKSDNILPDNMRGYVVDPSVDINMQDTSETGLKKAADSVFEKVDAILPNTVVVKYNADTNYEFNGFDVLSYFVEKAKEQDFYVVFLFEGEKYSVTKADAEKIIEKISTYNTDAVMLYDEKSDVSANIKEIKDSLNAKDIKFGVYCNDAPDEQTVINIIAADFCFVQINYSSENGAENIVRQWAQIALEGDFNIYGVIRNDLVRSGTGWTLDNEVNNTVKMLYNFGGFSGCVMYSHSKLQSDDNHTARNLYSYYEYFNNSDYTALTLTGAEIKNNEAIVFTGTTDNEFPMYYRCTATGKWQIAENSGEDGSFTAEIPLVAGENKVVLKHKNAIYTYHIDRAVDVMATQSAVIEEGVVKLTVKAVKGARVFASLANTVAVELVADSTEENGYVTYSSSYELSGWLLPLTAEQISFAATYNGIEDIVMCGKTKEITPYDNHNLGTATMCRVEKDYAETTSSASEDDTSDPTCTPQLSGAYGYVEKITVCDNNVILFMTSGMKLYCENTRLILGGFVLPENVVNLDSVVCAEDTMLTFSSTYDIFIKTVQAPQNYYKGFLQRIYNVEAYEAEYIDIFFMDTQKCSYTSEPDFTNSNVISRAEWYSNTEEGFMLLRLYFRNKGGFGGYTFEKNQDGNIEITLRKKADTLAGTVVMIDPGHGGYGSPGTNSKMTVYEKDVVFSVAQKTAQILRDHGATVIMTRSGDESVFLNERVEMIREYDPDIYISIHNDGSDDKSLYGTHTFYYRSLSMPLADAIHKQIVNAYRTYFYNDPASEEYEKVDMGVKFFPYMISRVEECPSVLIECGYLTNEKNAEFLTGENYQNVLATAIAQGVVDYLAG